jgi:23S rRNA (cytosine1962-C5)-methyltransferase
VFGQKEDSGEWEFRTRPPEPWQVTYENLRFNLKPTDFRHVGLFPEQAVNWKWIQETTAAVPNCKVLNLFAYTGGATLAATKTGAHVTHVDSSRPAMMWASENAKLTKIPKDRIRWIQEDAMKFVSREIRRGVRYDGVIMDPPRFGRGNSGEVWKLIEDLPELLAACRKVMSDNPRFILINAYTADMSSLAIRYLLRDMTVGWDGEIESGEIGLKQTSGDKVLPAGIMARWKR